MTLKMIHNSDYIRKVYDINKHNRYNNFNARLFLDIADIARKYGKLKGSIRSQDNTDSIYN